jgi:hypothetical protein
VHLLQHLQHFFSSLLSSKEFWAAILGALIGGLMTGWFTLLAQEQAAKDQRIGDRDTEREAIKGTLQAIATEVEIFKVKFLDAFKKVFKEPDPVASPASLASIARSGHSFFCVFESNAAMLGRVTDQVLRRKIVATYTCLKAIVDVVNHYSERREFWANLSHQTDSIGISEAKGEVEGWADNVRGNIPELETEIGDPLADIRKYLSA